MHVPHVRLRGASRLLALGAGAVPLAVAVGLLSWYGQGRPVVALALGALGVGLVAVARWVR